MVGSFMMGKAGDIIVNVSAYYEAIMEDRKYVQSLGTFVSLDK